MNVADLLRHLQSEHDEAAAHAGSLRRQIDDLTAVLCEAEARLAELGIARKVVEGIARPEAEPDPAAVADTYQRLLALFNDRPKQPFRARELHELLGLPTDEASVKTSPAAASAASSVRASSPNPAAASTRKGLNVL